MAALSQGQSSGKGSTGVSHGSSDKNRTPAQGHQGVQAQSEAQACRGRVKKETFWEGLPFRKTFCFFCFTESVFLFFSHGPGWVLARGWLPGSRLGVFVLLFDLGDAGLHPT